MKLENHMIALKEHTEALEWAIKRRNQTSIGFHASSGSIELLAILLHRLEKVPADFQLNHTWFKSDKIVKSKLTFDFPCKEDILSILERIEELRNPLCYGAPKPESTIDEILENFNKLKKNVGGILGDNFD